MWHTRIVKQKWGGGCAKEKMVAGGEVKTCWRTFDAALRTWKAIPDALREVKRWKMVNFGVFVGKKGN